jgi:hypothetical protein
MTEHHVLLLGAGVQSTAIYLLMRERKVAVPESLVAVFADTQEEPGAVYEHLAWLKSLGWPPIRIRTRGKLGDALFNDRAWKKGPTVVPAFTKIGTERPAMMPRRCTTDFKIEVIEKFVREEMLGLKPRQRRDRSIPVHQYYGISRDEARRAVSIRKRAEEKSFIPHFPLLELGWTRGDCLRYLQDRVPHQVPRSACVFCPFHNDREWLEIKQNDPTAWQRAVEIDRALRVHRSAAMREEPYLHFSLKPLDEVDLNPQAAFPGFTRECEGMCGV